MLKCKLGKTMQGFIRRGWMNEKGIRKLYS